MSEYDDYRKYCPSCVRDYEETMSETPRSDHYRVEFKRRKETSDLIEWIVDELAGVERSIAAAQAELAKQHEIFTATLDEVNAKACEFEEQLVAERERTGLLAGLLREWLVAEYDSMDDEWQPWVDSFTSRINAALANEKEK